MHYLALSCSEIATTAQIMGAQSWGLESLVEAFVARLMIVADTQGSVICDNYK
jgi:hypothetical protein